MDDVCVCTYAHMYICTHVPQDVYLAGSSQPSSSVSLLSFLFVFRVSIRTNIVYVVVLTLPIDIVFSCAIR